MPPGCAPEPSGRSSKAASRRSIWTPTSAQIDEILESAGAERDDDGSIIALRTVTRDGPSRPTSGRSVPARVLQNFTNGLLTLHGQNDQLRLMRAEEQRSALDRFAGVGAVLERYRKLRDEWLIARRISLTVPTVPGNGAGGRPAEVRHC